jgi:hypothetical protein
VEELEEQMTQVELFEWGAFLELREEQRKARSAKGSTGKKPPAKMGGKKAR